MVISEVTINSEFIEHEKGAKGGEAFSVVFRLLFRKMGSH
jgi:hypothetical protein